MCAVCVVFKCSNNKVYIEWIEVFVSIWHVQQLIATPDTESIERI